MTKVIFAWCVLNFIVSTMNIINLYKLQKEWKKLDNDGEN